MNENDLDKCLIGMKKKQVLEFVFATAEKKWLLDFE